MTETSFFKTTAFKVIAIICGLVIVGIIGIICVTATVLIANPEIFEDEYLSCNIQGIKLHGGIYTYNPTYTSYDGEQSYSEYEDLVASDDVVTMIAEANNDDSISAILIEVDSNGGLPVAGEEISVAIENSGKPVVAMIRQSGLSAAYWAISSADRIFASRNSNVGSIGITASYLEKMEKDTQYIELNSGKFKDTGNPDKPITDDEKKLILRDVNIIFENFVRDIARNRKLDVAEVKSIGDGSSVLGERAIELGLVDQIGGYVEVNKYLQSRLSEKPEICW